MPTYYSRINGWIGDGLKAIDDPVTMTEEQAKYLLIMKIVSVTRGDGTTPVVPVLPTIAKTDVFNLSRSGEAHPVNGSDIIAFIATFLPPVKVWTYPGLGSGFSRAISGMKQDEDIKFGTAVTGDDVISNATQLAARFRPLEGEFSASGTHLGGAGPTTINSEPQNYRFDFTSGNHIFDADGLRLQAHVDAGTFDLIVRGGLLSTAATGMTVNLPGASVTTPIADVGLVSNDLDNIEVGTVLNRANLGFCFVSAKDKANGTITFEEATAGGTTVGTPFKGNWALHFWKIAFCRIDATKTVVQGDTNIPLAKALPSWVVPGMIIRGVRRTSGATAGQDPRSSADMRITAIASDRMSFTIANGFSIGSGLTLEGANFAGVMILPGLYSAQIWSRRNYGPQVMDQQADGTMTKRGKQACSWEMTMPLQAWGTPAGYYSKAQIESYLAGALTAAFGFFPAIWFYAWRPGPNGDGQSSNVSIPWNELDQMEIFGRPGSGGRVLTMNLHDRPYRRDRNVASVSPGNRHRALKATWETSTADFKALTPDSLNLTFDAALTDGVKHTYGLVWTENKVIHYLDGIAICESDWSVETDFPHQMGINLACGMMTASQAANFILPQSNAMAEQNIKIHRIQSWS